MDRLSALGSPGYEDIAAAARDIGIPIEALRAMIDERMPPGEAAADTLAYRRVSDIEAKPIRWLWPGRIARGKVTVLAGHPGLGKGQAAVSLAAVVTTGGIWPVDRTLCERGSVIILSAEDDPADTIRPRLEAAGADLNRCWIAGAVHEPSKDGDPVARSFNLAKDIERLGDLARRLGDAALIDIDPITAYLGGIDSHKNADVRGLPLAAMAAERDAAIVCVSHLTKAGGTEALLRVMGSLGFVAAARSAYLIAKDPLQRQAFQLLGLKR
ncbi:MAG: AAA family ATPase [Gammaproteobacteria bacterium]